MKFVCTIMLTLILLNGCKIGPSEICVSTGDLTCNGVAVMDSREKTVTIPVKNTLNEDITLIVEEGKEPSSTDFCKITFIDVQIDEDQIRYYDKKTYNPVRINENEDISLIFGCKFLDTGKFMEEFSISYEINNVIEPVTILVKSVVG